MTDRRRARPSNRDARDGRHGRSATVDNPRRVAYEVLAAVSTQDAYANLVLPRLLRHRGVTGRDAAFATELCYGALRRRGTLDAVIAAASGRSIDVLDQPVADVLRLGAYQLLYTRVAAHAAANTTVSLARKVCGHRPAGFVNAVMRKISRHDVADWTERLSTGEEYTDLALRYSHPEWITRRFAEALDLTGGAVGRGTNDRDDAETTPGADVGFSIEVDETGFLPETYATPTRPDTEDSGPAGAGPAEAGPTGAAEAARDVTPDGAGRSPAEAEPGPSDTDAAATGFDAAFGPTEASDTTVGPPTPDDSSDAGPLAELAAALAADNVSPAVQLFARPGRITAAELAERTGGRRGRWSPYAVELVSGDPADLAAIRDGAAHVQDEGSQLVALALAAAPLDGRDERWLDLCAGPGGKAALLGSLAAERRAELTAVEVAEHRARLVAQSTAGLDVEVVTADGREFTAVDDFDRVLVDAPCSGLGALRRRPEARWRRTEADLTGLAELQAELLASALRLARPGGLVAYVTCSPVLAETIGILATVHDASLVDARPYFPPDMPHLGDGPTVQLWPHRHGTDAMFCALLRRDA